MQKSGWGRIINIAGTAGWQPSNTAMAVGLSNAAVINWTKSMSLQYAADGILVTSVAPGSIETPRQVGRPEEIAAVVVFLASEQSSYMTGTCVTVDGGVTRGI